jgi:alpha-tubulin suppressor-like RCC1 family protein
MVRAGRGRGFFVEGDNWVDEDGGPVLVPEGRQLAAELVVQVDYSGGADITTQLAAVTVEGRLFVMGEQVQLGGGGVYPVAGDMWRVPRLVGGALSSVRVVSVALGDEHAVAVTAEGHAYTWGMGGLGRLGHGTGDDEAQPRRVLHALEGERVVQAAAGSRHTAVVTGSGKLLTFGNHHEHRLGYDTDGNEQLVPREVGGSLAGRRVVSAAVGDNFTVALTADGVVSLCGAPGAQGSELDVLGPPEVVAGLAQERVVQIAAGWDHCVALTVRGKVWTLGINSEGQLCRPVPEDEDVLPPAEVSDHAELAGEEAVGVQANGQRTGVVTASGRVVLFGEFFGDEGEARELPE